MEEIINEENDGQPSRPFETVLYVDSYIMTRKEAGEPCDPGMEQQELEEETTVITFELQPQTDTQ